MWIRMLMWRNGSRGRFRLCWEKFRGGSSPSISTKLNEGLNYMEVSIHSCSLGYCLIGTHSKKILMSVELGLTIEDCYRTFINRWNTATYRHYLDIKSERPDPSVTESVLYAVNTGVYHDKNLPLYLPGTRPKKETWEALTKIKPGTTATYKQIAEQTESPRAIRAVANTIGDNPLAIIIPCHRVVRSDGSIGGYRWGEEMKKKILQREKLTT